jgi:hypothetical protein
MLQLYYSTTAIVKAIRQDERTGVIKKFMGPSEDLVEVECIGEKINLFYDLDYGIDPVVCSEKSAPIIKEIFEKAINYYCYK